MPCPCACPCLCLHPSLCLCLCSCLCLCLCSSVHVFGQYRRKVHVLCLWHMHKRLRKLLLVQLCTCMMKVNASALRERALCKIYTCFMQKDTQTLVNMLQGASKRFKLTQRQRPSINSHTSICQGARCVAHAYVNTTKLSTRFRSSLSLVALHISYSLSFWHFLANL